MGRSQEHVYMETARRMDGDREALAKSLCLTQAYLSPLSPGSPLGWVLRLVQAKSGGGGGIIYFDTIRAFSPSAAAIFGSPGEQGYG